MKWGPRDQWICMILPPVLTAALLFWLILRPLFADVSALRESIPEQRRLIFAPEAQINYGPSNSGWKLDGRRTETDRSGRSGFQEELHGESRGDLAGDHSPVRVL